MSDSVRDYEERLRAGKVEREPGTLPPHYPSCFGCGPESEFGLRAVARKVGEEIHASYTFSPKHSGAPGIVHGGIVAALVDDVCGFLLFVVRKPAVTRTLEVEYLKPVLVGVQYDLVAKLDRVEGRKLFVSCEGRSPEGELTFRGGGLFLVVDVSHFDQGTNAGEGQAPVAL
ncbi:MAG: Thioesterase superfamily protein [Frankiales bacterium]|nr:Thioesterase superfamily protein [Frankiales bacterium]